MDKRTFVVWAALVALVILIAGAVRAPSAAQGGGPAAAPAPATARQGAWVDAVRFTEINTASVAVEQLQADELDVYAYTLGDPALWETVKADAELGYSESMGSSNELTFNPYGPNFEDGRLNPFSNARIREAMNRLIDRSTIVREIFGGLGVPKLLPLTAGFPDAVRYAATVQALEEAYAYRPEEAEQTIAAELLAMGAAWVDEQWTYNGQPITVICLIRTEDARRPLGDYVADQLEAIGFVTERLYKTRSEASPIWVQGDPAEGLFHIYTGGWITTAVSRDQGYDFSFYYTPNDYSIPLWQTYQPSPQFDEIALRLRDHDYGSLAERETLFEQALALSLNDSGSGSVRVWIEERQSFSPRRADTQVASDRAGGIAGSQLWPYVARFKGVEGGTLRIAQPGALVNPWNPVAGSNWIYDQMPIRATQDYALVSDPNDGLVWPQRAERAEVVVQDGLPMGATHDWVELSFAPQIDVPADAWVDWDAGEGRFLTAGEMYPGGLTARVKSTVYYPEDLFSTVTWHDGSPLTLGDFVMAMILTFDPGKVGSAIYDPALAPGVEAFLDHFRGVRIASADPLVIETYDDGVPLDAELAVVTWWPNYGYGPGAWHNVALGVRADAAHALAFSADKADDLGIPWMDLLSEPSLGILQGYLVQSAAESYIPYAPTLGLYVDEAEADARWASLQAWYGAQGHFWLGTGPFYVDEVSHEQKTLLLSRFAAFPDPAGRWDAFAAYRPGLDLNFYNGAPGSFLNVTGDDFPPNQTATVTVNGQEVGQVQVDGSGVLSFTLSTEDAGEGRFELTVEVNPEATTWFSLRSELPERPREGQQPLVEVPAGISQQATFLPFVWR